jgi:hypothetical protein
LLPDVEGEAYSLSLPADNASYGVTIRHFSATMGELSVAHAGKRELLAIACSPHTVFVSSVSDIGLIHAGGAPLGSQHNANVVLRCQLDGVISHANRTCLRKAPWRSGKFAYTYQVNVGRFHQR